MSTNSYAHKRKAVNSADRDDDCDDVDDDKDSESGVLRAEKHARHHMWQRSPQTSEVDSMVDTFSHFVNRYEEPSATVLSNVLLEYQRAMEKIAELRWIPQREDELTGEVYYRRMTNPNVTINQLIER